MPYKKHKWMKYGGGRNIIEIKVKDEIGKQLDFFKCNNKEAFKIIAEILRDKYGFKFTEDKREKEKKEEIQREKDWLEKDMEW